MTRLQPQTPSPQPPTTALLVMVHGSPRPESNDDMFAVVDVVRARGVYPIVEVGFMECNEPAIPDAIERCVEQGVRRVVAVPYFLHTGNHVADDLPTLLEQAQARYPHVEFLMGDFLGRDVTLDEIVRDRAAQAQQLSQAPA
jgi:sirohydrochlorin ferrochelatase